MTNSEKVREFSSLAAKSQNKELPNYAIPFSRYVSAHSSILRHPCFPIPISSAIVAALASPRKYRSATSTLVVTAYFAFLDINAPPEASLVYFFPVSTSGGAYQELVLLFSIIVRTS